MEAVIFKQLRTTTPRNNKIYALQQINTTDSKMYNKNTTTNSSIMKLVKIKIESIIKYAKREDLLENYFDSLSI